MSKFFGAVAFAAAASAAVLRRGDSMEGCTFQITASGGVNGVMGQFEDGQNRVNGSYPAAYYTYQNGGIVDANGRGCIVTLDNDVTHQFQCDLNKEPSYGFTIAQDGSILYNGNSQFYACPYMTEYNVYTKYLKDQDECKPVNLSTDATCAAGAHETGPHGPGYTPGYTGKPHPSTAQQSAPGYGKPTGSVPSSGGQSSQSTYAASSLETFPAQSGETSAPVVPGDGGKISKLSTPIPYVETYPAQSTTASAPGYGSVVSVPGYGSEGVETSLPAPSIGPSPSHSSQPSAPGYGGETPIVFMPGYGGETPVVSAPGYGIVTPQATSTPKIPVSSTSQDVPGYRAPTTSVATESNPTVTVETTVYVCGCEATATPEPSGTTVPSSPAEASIPAPEKSSTCTEDKTVPTSSKPNENSPMTTSAPTTPIPTPHTSTPPESTTCTEEEQIPATSLATKFSTSSSKPHSSTSSAPIGTVSVSVPLAGSYGDYSPTEY